MRTQRAALADQLERAATSVALNIAEAGGRAWRDRVRAADRRRRGARGPGGARGRRRVGYVDAAEVAPADAVADRLGGVLYGRMRRGG
ncbi:MAG: four helix bundle protein [Kofleriaceae bacterium]|nr:four helix bundle protein [Kofleriaceae bacterium]